MCRGPVVPGLRHLSDTRCGCFDFRERLFVSGASKQRLYIINDEVGTRNERVVAGRNDDGSRGSTCLKLL